MGGLELLNPKGLWLLTGLVPLIVLYILKIRRQRAKVPSTWLWAAARRDLLAKHPFKRLVAELPLILQILALVALSIALARPAIRGRTIAGDHVAIVIDTSASMGTVLAAQGGEAAATPQPTRLSSAQRAANDVISALSPGADAIVIEASKDARVVAPLDRDERRLRAAVASVAVREVEGDLIGAVALAADRLRSLGGSKRVIVITDGALAKDAPLVATGAELQVITVGDAAENAAIVRIDVRAGVDPATKRDQVQTFAMVRNYGKAPKDVYVSLSVEGQADPVASRRVMLDPGAKVPVVLTFEPKSTHRGQGLTMRLSPGDAAHRGPLDALPIDDVAFGRVPAGLKQPVTVASREYSWIARAVDADPQVDLQKINVEQLATVNVDPEALVIVEGDCPERAPGQDLLVVGPPTGKPCFGVEVGKVVENPPITSWENGDPRFRFLTLDGIHVAKSHELDARGAGTALVRSAQTTLVADASVPGRMVTLVAFDVGESDWPLRASFVLFVRNVVELARLHRSQGAAGPARTGEALRLALPQGTPSVRVEGPGMPEHEVAAKGGFAIVPPIERAGLYRIRWTAPNIGGALVAANLTSERESNVTPRPIPIEGGRVATSTPASAMVDAHNEWGTWLALLAAALIAFDVYWITRKPRARPAAKATGANA